MGSVWPSPHRLWLSAPSCQDSIGAKNPESNVYVSEVLEISNIPTDSMFLGAESLKT